MALTKMVAKHIFHWMVVAGLLIAAQTVTSGHNELSLDQNQMWGTQLGLTEISVTELSETKTSDRHLASVGE